MKKIFFAITLLLFCNLLKAQVGEGDWNVSFSHKVALANTKLMRSDLTGVEVEYMVADNVGLNYTMYGGDGVFHMPGGFAAGLCVLAGVAALTNGNFDVDPEVLLYILAIPEGVTLNINILKNTYISPYINPAGLEFHQYPEQEFHAFFMGSTGVRLKMFVPLDDNHDIVFSGFAEAQLEYAEEQKLGVRAGLSMGIAF